MGPPTDPGPSGGALVPKWSVRPWLAAEVCIISCSSCLMNFMKRHFDSQNCWKIGFFSYLFLFSFIEPVPPARPSR
ncbi:unnamed protein product [Staurois parvus]|uniref:Uncharacterized protein n=1 Tax=Staurois parvus TaxID=386267 RepID=A0ABN9G766_9NEOB|nr:unnamed protein product [Staurois parvus]